MIALEFGLDRKTARKRARALGFSPPYSTDQALAIVRTDLQGEKLRLVREQADRVALENAAARRELLPAKEIVAVVQRGLAAIAARAQELPELSATCKASIRAALAHTLEQVRSLAGAADR